MGDESTQPHAFFPDHETPGVNLCLHFSRMDLARVLVPDRTIVAQRRAFFIFS